jgi:hypothetical protein
MRKGLEELPPVPKPGFLKPFFSGNRAKDFFQIAESRINFAIWKEMSEDPFRDSRRMY